MRPFTVTGNSIGVAFPTTLDRSTSSARRKPRRKVPASAGANPFRDSGRIETTPHDWGRFEAIAYKPSSPTLATPVGDKRYTSLRRAVSALLPIKIARSTATLITAAFALAGVLVINITRGIAWVVMTALVMIGMLLLMGSALAYYATRTAAKWLSIR